MNVHELEQKREELITQLQEFKDMKNHRTYKAVEAQLKDVRAQIKSHYRSVFKNGK